MVKGKSALRIVISRIFGIFIFLFLLFLANYLAPIANIVIFQQLVNFLNDNLVLLVVMSLVFLVGELFLVFHFPLSLPAPVFNAIASVLLVMFIFRIFTLIDRFLDKNIFQIFNRFAFIIYPLVFIIVLIAGYVSLFAGLTGIKKDKKK